MDEFDAVPIDDASSGRLLGFAAAHGDLNADGIADLVVTSPEYEVHWDQRGAAWTILGDRTPRPGRIEDQSNFIVRSREYRTSIERECFGVGVALGDFDWDGRDQIAIAGARVRSGTRGTITIYEE